MRQPPPTEMWPSEIRRARVSPAALPRGALQPPSPRSRGNPRKPPGGPARSRAPAPPKHSRQRHSTAPPRDAHPVRAPPFALSRFLGTAPCCSLFLSLPCLERFHSTFLQISFPPERCANVQRDIPNISFERLLRLPPRHAFLLQPGHDLDPQSLGGPLQLAANGGFVDVQHARDLGQGAVVEEIRRQNEFVF